LIISRDFVLEFNQVINISLIEANWDILTSFEVGMFSVIVCIIQIIGYPLMT